MDRTYGRSRGISMGCDSDTWELGSEAGPILPSQFFEGRNKNDAMEPEKRLMLAVLTDALHCYQVGCDAQKASRIQAFMEAEEWLFSTKGYGPFSFENVCYSLDIAPDCLRKTVRKWGVQRVSGVRPTAVRRAAR